MRVEVRIAGFGGQGVGLVGYILGKALALYDGFEVVMTQSYGPEARGGASSVDLVVSDEPVDYPFVHHPDILVALSQEAYSKFWPKVKDEAWVIVDEDLVEPIDCDNPHLIPATRIAEEVGRRIVANMVILGFFTSVSHLVTPKAIEKAIETTLNTKIVSLNLQAFTRGVEYSKDQMVIERKEDLAVLRDSRHE